MTGPPAPGPAALVAIGGAVGAVGRHLVGRAVGGGRYPAGTLVVNVVGSLLLGLVTFADAGGQVVLLVGTGACGAFTTFSSLSHEVIVLWAAGDRVLAAAHAVGNLLGALAGIGVAWLVVGSL